MLGIQLKFQTCEKQKNRENKVPKEKQSHAQDSIYVVRQFAYVHRVAGISLLSKKITMCGYNVFLSQKQQQDKTLITKKKNGFYILRIGFTMGYKNRLKIFCRPKPPLHGLNLSKSPIIRVKSGHQPDQIMSDDDFSWNKIHPLSSL